MIKYISYITLILFICLPAVHANVRAQNSTSMWQKIASLFYTDDYEEVKDLKKNSMTPFYIGKNYSGKQNETGFITYVESKNVD